MADATLVRGRHDNRVTLAAAASGGEVRQLADGRAAVLQGLQGLNAATSGDLRSFKTDGIYAAPKTAGVAVLDGAPLWWDHGAGSATPVPPTSGRDFYLGAAVGDGASGASECAVNLNVEPTYVYDAHRDGADTVPVLTAGSPYLYSRGGTIAAAFSATAEAQKLDILSRRSFPVGSNWILEALVTVTTTADADVADLSIGVANATHASDADSIAESCLFHFDLGADLNIDAESDDGTTEVAATDTTVDFAVGTPVHLVIDGRDPADIQFYVNGVNVLPATVFTLELATGPLKALFHLEKTANDSPGVVNLDVFRVRIAEQ